MTILNKDNNCCESRGSKIIRNGEFLEIPADSQSIIVDNIGQLFDMQKQLRISQHGSDNENSKGYIFWDFLKNWTSLKEDEKKSNYDRFACHEINIFIYFKDQKFFQTTVRPFIQDKIEKTFVDYFLLNNVDMIRFYA